VLKQQDILVVTRLLLALKRRETVTYPLLSQWTGLSASEAHSAVKRAAASGLLAKIPRGGTDGFPWSPSWTAVEEFLLHGFKYVFPLQQGTLQRGTPTGISAGLDESSAPVFETETWVWPNAEGSARGIGIAPLYKTVPGAAMRDGDFHKALAALDLIRSTPHRLRRVGESWIKINLLNP